MYKNKKAFTLIELLVVIAIIGILATISVLALSNARAKSRDAKRAGDMKQIQTALELFFNDNNRYPTTEEWNTGKIYSTSTGATSTYMQIIPTAPTPADGNCSSGQNTVSYTPASDGSSYSISFCLGNTTGTLTPGPKCLTPAGILDAGCNVAIVPSSIPSLSAWYDSSGLIINTDNSYGTVNSIGRINNWKDISGNSRHLITSWGGSDAVTLNPSLSYFNNKPGAVFNEGDKSNWASPFPLITSPLSIMVVYNQQANNQAANIDSIVNLSGYQGGGTGYFWVAYNHTNGTIELFTSGGSGVKSIAASAPSVPFSTIVSGIFNGGNSKLYVNGSLSSSGVLDNYSSADIILGADPWWQFLDGSIAEVLVFGSALSDSDRHGVEVYLNNKYNIY